MAFWYNLKYQRKLVSKRDDDDDDDDDDGWEDEDEDGGLTTINCRLHWAPGGSDPFAPPRLLLPFSKQGRQPPLEGSIASLPRETECLATSKSETASPVGHHRIMDVHRINLVLHGSINPFHHHNNITLRTTYIDDFRSIFKKKTGRIRVGVLR